MSLPAALERLVQEFTRLPGIGRKTAQRLAFGVLRYSQEEAKNLAESVLEVKTEVRYCSRCFGFTDRDPCRICEDPTRDRQQICVVEQPNNIFAIEKSGLYQGMYHVLMGTISPLDGVGPEQLKIAPLRERVRHDAVQELILATNPTVHGEATALLLQREFNGTVPTLTRLARGLPAGGDLEYVDDVTLYEAFSGRQRF
ncbi:MAG: recombination protein RecR [Deltaproteobacteria bacterium]|nr:recombination protein RecR [Deltaproteobacteria bacterium]MDP7463222.1 recombination mediator RecR [SAR324 cluster bacterium]